MPWQKASGPFYSDNIIFATGTNGYRCSKPMTGSEAGKAGKACGHGIAAEATKAAKAAPNSNSGTAPNSNNGTARVCEYNDAYRRFADNTYEVARALKSGGGIGIVSTPDKKSRRHNGDGAMNIDYVYTGVFDFVYSDRNNVKRRDH